MALEIVVVCPLLVLKIGSPVTLIALAIVVEDVTLKVAASVGKPTSASDAEPSAAAALIESVAPASTTTAPVKEVLLPDRVSVPPAIVRPPLPEKVPE